MEFKKRTKEYKDDLPIFDLVIEMEDETGIPRVSVVDDPAIELYGHLFSKQKEEKKDHRFFIYFDSPPVHPSCRCRISFENGGEWIFDEEACGHCKDKAALFYERKADLEKKRAKKKRNEERVADRNKRKEERKATENPRGSGRKNFEQQFSVDTERKILVGPVLIANKLIGRKDEDGNYYARFTPEEILKNAQKFNARAQRTINIDHSNRLLSATVLESWIVEDSRFDKAFMYGYTPEDLPIGSWMMAIKFQSDDDWNEVKNRKKVGFSVEGLFKHRQVNFSSDDIDYDSLIDTLTEDEVLEALFYAMSETPAIADFTIID